jgi:hypothetical protein
MRRLDFHLSCRGAAVGGRRNVARGQVFYREKRKISRDEMRFPWLSRDSTLRLDSFVWTVVCKECKNGVLDFRA